MLARIPQLTLLCLLLICSRAAAQTGKAAPDSLNSSLHIVRETREQALLNWREARMEEAIERATEKAMPMRAGEAVFGKPIAALIPLDSIRSIFVPYFPLRPTWDCELSDAYILDILRQSVITANDRVRTFDPLPWKRLTITDAGNRKTRLYLMVGSLGIITLPGGKSYFITIPKCKPSNNELGSQ